MVEMVSVIVALALLVAFGLAQWRAHGERGRTEAMRETLRRLAVAEDSYAYDFGVYASDVTALQARGFASAGPVRVQVVEATRVGWAATASHPETAVQCHLFVGTAAPLGAATTAGEVACG